MSQEKLFAHVAAYISDMLQPVSSLQRQTNLRSATNSELFVPRTRLRVHVLVQQPLAYGMLYPLISSKPPLY